jgi:Peptidase M66
MSGEMMKLRWLNAFLAALLLASAVCAACGDSGDEAPSPASALGLDAGALDAGPVVQVILPPPADAAPLDAAKLDAGQPLQLGNATVDAATSALVDAAMPESLGAANPCGAGPAPLAAAIKVRELSLYQTVKVPLYKDNVWVANRNAMVVQGKKSFVRVFVDPQNGFTARMLRGALVLDNAGKNTVLTSERTITRASTDDAADSTFDFPVDGALIGADTKVSVSLLEMTCTAASPATSGARLPATGSQELDAEGTGKLHVVIVPVTLAGRTPDTGEAQLDKVRDALRAYYPVAEVEVSAHAPISYGGTVQATGTGWAELLMQIGRQRQQDAVASNVYYFGWIAPAASFKDYCRSGCVLGLAPQTTSISRMNQIGLGVGFVDDNTYTTVVHELGHAHGLPHAPCVPRGGTIDGADAKFPYASAKIGVWGWDARSAKLMSPETNYDVMSYCDPVWISDYNYQKLAARSKAVNNAAYVYTPSDKQAPQSWRGVIVYADGSARWTGMTSREQPGELSDARALDAEGAELSALSVVRVPLSNDRESFLYVPELDASWVSLDLGDRKLLLSDIAPAQE